MSVSRRSLFGLAAGAIAAAVGLKPKPKIDDAFAAELWSKVLRDQAAQIPIYDGYIGEYHGILIRYDDGRPNVKLISPDEFYGRWSEVSLPDSST